MRQIGTRGILTVLASSVVLSGCGVTDGGQQAAARVSTVPAPLSRCAHTATLVGHTDTVWQMAWSPDGRRLASTSEDYTTRIWDTIAGRQIRRIEDPQPVSNVAWSPGGKRLSTDSDNAVRVWDAATGTQAYTVDAQAGPWPAWEVWSPDGTRLAGVDDWKASIWDAATGVPIRSLDVNGHRGYVATVAWSPDGTRLAAAHVDLAAPHDDAISIWDVATGKEIQSLRGLSSPTVVAWSPDGTRLAGAGLGAAVWDATKGTLIHRLAQDIPNSDERRVVDIAWAPDGSRLADADSGVAVIYDAATGKEIRSLYNQSVMTTYVTTVVWSHDGAFLATSGGGDMDTAIWDTATGKMAHTLVGGGGEVAWSPDGSCLATTNKGNAVVIWDWQAEPAKG